MKKQINGFSRMEMLVLIVIVVIIISFSIPKLFISTEVKPELMKAKEVTQVIYSAYNLCQVIATSEGSKCDTVHDIINNINYEEFNPKDGFARLLDQTELKFNSEDLLNDGTSLIVKLPDNYGQFTLYITGQGQFLSKKPGKKAAGGQETQNTIDPFK
jgi:type II secretory pathway pseudopilin PulG